MKEEQVHRANRRINDNIFTNNLFGLSVNYLFSMKVRLQTNDDVLHIHSRYLYSMNGALIHFAVSGCLLVRLDHNRRFLCRNFRGNNRSLIYVLKLKASVVG